MIESAERDVLGLFAVFYWGSLPFAYELLTDLDMRSIFAHNFNDKVEARAMSAANLRYCP